jgi:hypothetical protein
MEILFMVVPLAGKGANIFHGVLCMHERNMRLEEPQKKLFLRGKGSESTTVAQDMVVTDLEKVGAAASGP